MGPGSPAGRLRAPGFASHSRSQMQGSESIELRSISTMVRFAFGEREPMVGPDLSPPKPPRNNTAGLVGDAQAEREPTEPAESSPRGPMGRRVGHRLDGSAGSKKTAARIDVDPGGGTLGGGGWRLAH